MRCFTTEFGLHIDQLAQLIAALRQPRAHRPSRKLEDGGGILVRHALQADEQNELPMV
jgi:hypothetical protein